MVALPLVLIVLAALLLAWMLHSATVYTLPCVAGWGAATLSYNSNAGLVGAAIIGVAVATGIVVSQRLMLARMQHGPTRSLIAFMIIVPSLIMGYNIGLDVLEGAVPSNIWRHAISIGYAVLGGWLAFLRLTEFED